jgi:hypothetical protein
VLQVEFTRSRKLDKGNPNPGNIGEDFNRLGLSFWRVVQQDHAQNTGRQAALERMNEWRNAISHQDFTSKPLTPQQVVLGTVRSWRRVCGGLADSFDRVMRTHLRTVLGSYPW